MVPKGTLRAPVSPFQTTVWRYVGGIGERTRGDFSGWGGKPEHSGRWWGGRGKPYKEEGEVEEEEERR